MILRFWKWIAPKKILAFFVRCFANQTSVKSKEVIYSMLEGHSLVEMFNCIVDTVEDSSSVRSYRKFLIANLCYNTHPFNGPFSRTTQVSRYQKGKTNLDFTEARDSEWQWHQLEHMQVCTSLQTDNHANTPPLVFYRPDALPVAQPTASKNWRHYFYLNQ